MAKLICPDTLEPFINWNTPKDMNSDNYSMNIVDGMKVIVCKLKIIPDILPLHYPTDELRLSQLVPRTSFRTKKWKVLLLITNWATY